VFFNAGLIGIVVFSGVAAFFAPWTLLPRLGPHAIDVGSMAEHSIRAAIKL
jgi:hypothetical protein